MNISSIATVVYDMGDFGESGVSWFDKGLYKIEVEVKVGLNNHTFTYDYSFLKYTLYCSDSFMFKYYRSLSSEYLNNINHFIIIVSDFNYKSEIDTDTVIKFLFSDHVNIDCDIFPGRILNMYEILYFEWSKNERVSFLLDYIKSHDIRIKQMRNSKIIITSNLLILMKLYHDFDSILYNLDMMCHNFREIFYGNKEIEFSIYSYEIYRDDIFSEFINYIINSNNYNLQDISLHIKTSVRLSDSYKNNLINRIDGAEVFKKVVIEDFKL